MSSSGLSINSLFGTDIQDDEEALSINTLFGEVKNNSLELDRNKLVLIKKGFKKQLYKKYIEIVNKCWRQVEAKADKGGNELYYPVPLTSSEKDYSVEECIRFIISRFKGIGVKCEKVPETNYIYLNWKDI